MKAELHQSVIDGIDVVTITGRLTAAEVPEVRQTLAATLEQGEALLVLDLTDLGFVDSSALSTFISALKHARSRNGDVALAGLTPAVRALIELTGLHQVFGIYDDATAAAAGLRRDSTSGKN